MVYLGVSHHLSQKRKSFISLIYLFILAACADEDRMGHVLGRAMT